MVRQSRQLGVAVFELGTKSGHLLRSFRHVDHRKEIKKTPPGQRLHFTKHYFLQYKNKLLLTGRVNEGFVISFENKTLDRRGSLKLI